jgi:hypothetical protein
MDFCMESGIVFRDFLVGGSPEIGCAKGVVIMNAAPPNLDPTFATWYAQHVLKAREAQMSDEMRAVQRERLEREEARRACFRRWFIINGVETFFASIRFIVLATGFLFGFVAFWMAFAIISMWAYIFFLPFARVACYHHTLPDVDACSASEWRIPETNLTLGASHLNEIYVGFKTLNAFISSYFDLDRICVQVYSGYGMNFTQIKMENFPPL